MQHLAIFVPRYAFLHSTADDISQIEPKAISQSILPRPESEEEMVYAESAEGGRIGGLWAIEGGRRRWSCGGMRVLVLTTWVLTVRRDAAGIVETRRCLEMDGPPFQRSLHTTYLALHFALELPEAP